MPNDYYCSVSNCKYSDQNNNGCKTAQRKTDANKITFYDLPNNDVELSKQWLKNIHKNNWLLSPTPKICSFHFSADCFDAKNGRLKKRAVPTIFEELELDRKNHIRIYSRCVVPNCRKSSIAKSLALPNDYVTLHGLPVQDHEKLKQWICALRLDPALIETATRDMVVCSDHFVKKDFRFSNRTVGWGGLKEDAVPHLVSDVQQDNDIISDPSDNIHSKPPNNSGTFKTSHNEVTPLLKECRIRLDRCDNLIKKNISVEGKVKDEVIEPGDVPLETSTQWENSSEQNKSLRESFVDPLWPSRATTSKRPSEDSTNGIIFESGPHDKESAPSHHPPVVPVSLHMVAAPLHNEPATNGFQSEMQYTVASTCLNMLYVKCEQCEEHVAMSKGNSNFDGSTLAVRCICSRGHETIWYSQPQVPNPGLCNWVPSSCETMELLPDECVMIPNDD